MTCSSKWLTSSSRSDITRAKMRTTRASSIWLNGRNNTRAAFGRITIFVRRTIIADDLSRCLEIHSVTHRRKPTLAGLRHLVQTDHPALQRLDLYQCAEERQGRFRTFVQIDAVEVQAIPATAGVRIVDAGIEVILAQKPAKCATRLDHPKAVTRDLIGFV